jgi:hypoxanthine phosphoribosyltransferase
MNLNISGPEVGEIIFTESLIQERVVQLADQISSDYKGKDVLLVSVLKGGVIFLADLLRKLSIPAAIDFMAISSYGGSESTGVVRLLKDLDTDIQGIDLLVIEDIVDTGLTLNYLINNLKTRNPASIEVCTLLDRPRRRIADIDIKYTGFQLPDVFVIGYGLDHMGKYRQLPYIAALNVEPY